MYAIRRRRIIRDVLSRLQTLYPVSAEIDRYRSKTVRSSGEWQTGFGFQMKASFDEEHNIVGKNAGKSARRAVAHVMVWLYSKTHWCSKIFTFWWFVEDTESGPLACVSDHLASGVVNSASKGRNHTTSDPTAAL